MYSRYPFRKIDFDISKLIGRFALGFTSFTRCLKVSIAENKFYLSFFRAPCAVIKSRFCSENSATARSQNANHLCDFILLSPFLYSDFILSAPRLIFISATDLLVLSS